MLDNPRTLAVLAAGGSLALLLAAWGFQYLGGLAPCAMCVWQRWPHALAVAAGGLALVTPLAAWLGLGGALATAGIGGYHTGVERGWWEGPSTCSSGEIGGLSPDELLAQIMEAPLVRCDEVAWQMLGLSMASWNVVLSLGLAGLWALALLRARRA
ncbi:disulphide bond formation protein DsbB [Dinoroseobacter shibae DFL 12 = DSM 16493]|jgi:disulfide bond formation protein DsbB|uniref:Disulphide bond formation protein DsbB n=1 Tax=Dinoroseobacter shibae (strain DSM 16493 / NCIMB 14021 / DFL 12) TaxID=398580 RepID=A8LK21_DINSH|nr:disulfide bond formation protein B [Dinoroseobacter shibae]ABV93220.1 disulphide bond formation protein DsbB [Dinoroseobacter shibae DFL 12 = DSM 16493]URF48140.1 disulfide bond formation protein B [Dinoroseobacter shibae]URF52450.1 disulfide bond formation protein B [Dinoroseobacter shibae]